MVFIHREEAAHSVLHTDLAPESLSIQGLNLCCSLQEERCASFQITA